MGLLAKGGQLPQGVVSRARKKGFIMEPFQDLAARTPLLSEGFRNPQGLSLQMLEGSWPSSGPSPGGCPLRGQGYRPKA